MSSLTPPLQIPEIIRMCANFFSPRDKAKIMLVSKTWNHNVAPALWERLGIHAASRVLYPLDDESSVLPWRHLRKYGHYVQSVELSWEEDQSAPDSYRQVSEAKLWRIVCRLSNLKHLTMYGVDLETSTTRSFEKICTRLKSLSMRNCTVPLSRAKKENSPWTIQELSVTGDCEVDIVGFIARCPLLEVLNILEQDAALSIEDNERNIANLGALLDSGHLPNLRHLDISFENCREEVTATFLRGRRCMQGFHAVKIGTTVLSSLRPHFSTISKLNARGPRGFWREVLASCPLLLTARQVSLSIDDIISGTAWVCTSLTEMSLELSSDRETHKHGRGHVRFDLGDYTDTRQVQDALFRRIGNLTNLEVFHIEEAVTSVGYLGVKASHMFLHQGLYRESWKSLSNMEHLSFLSLGYGFSGTLDDEMTGEILKLKGLKRLEGRWRQWSGTTMNILKLQSSGIQVYGH